MSQPLWHWPEALKHVHTSHTEETVFMVELHTDVPSHPSHPFPTNSLTPSAYSQLPASKKTSQKQLNTIHLFVFQVEESVLLL